MKIKSFFYKNKILLFMLQVITGVHLDGQLMASNVLCYYENEHGCLARLNPEGMNMFNVS